MNQIVKFFPSKTDKQLLSVLEQTKSDYLSGKIIKEDKKETHVVVLVPGSTNELRIVKGKDSGTFKKVI